MQIQAETWWRSLPPLKARLCWGQGEWSRRFPSANSTSLGSRPGVPSPLFTFFVQHLRWVCGVLVCACARFPGHRGRSRKAVVFAFLLVKSPWPPLWREDRKPVRCRNLLGSRLELQPLLFFLFFSFAEGRKRKSKKKYTSIVDESGGSSPQEATEKGRARRIPCARGARLSNPILADY